MAKRGADLPPVGRDTSMPGGMPALPPTAFGLVFPIRQSVGRSVRLVNSFPVGLRFAREARVGLARGVGLLALEFLETLPALGRERAAVEGCLNRAAGFAAMRAIAEPTLAGEVRDIGECGVERTCIGFPELQLAHARRVNHQCAGGGDDQLAVGGRVPALAHRIADRVRVLAFAAEE